MNQEKPIQNVQLKFACEQDWHKMTPCGDGRFCGVCQKNVFDFSNKSQADLDKVLHQNNGNICGRFQQNQVKKPLLARNRVKKATLIAASIAAAGCLPFELQYAAQSDENMYVMSGIESPFMGKFAPTIDSTPYFLGVIVEQQAEFIGGQQAMFAFLKENMRTPKFENRDGVKSITVFIGFTVNTDGSITNIAVKGGAYSAFNAEAMRLVQLMSGKWKAAKLNGKLKQTDFTIPIKFLVM
jgi:TonB family protein